MPHRDKLEPVADGFIAFHTESGERWRHKDVTYTPQGREPGICRLFVSDKGEERRYVFGPKDPRDATIADLREQLKKAEPVPAGEGIGARSAR
jgi:hypothetical protein